MKTMNEVSGQSRIKEYAATKKKLQKTAPDHMIMVGAVDTEAENCNTSYGSAAMILGTTSHPYDYKA